MGELKIYKKQTIVYLYNWEPIITTLEKEKIMQALNSWAKFLDFDWEYVAISNICRFTDEEIGEVESFILNFDKRRQNNLRNIIKDRQWKWLKVNIEVLKNAYKSQYWEDL